MKQQLRRTLVQTGREAAGREATPTLQLYKVLTNILSLPYDLLTVVPNVEVCDATNDQLKLKKPGS